MDWREQTVKPRVYFNVDRGTGEIRGKFDVYERACPPRERKKINVWHIIFFWGGGVIVYLLQQGILAAPCLICRAWP